MVYKQEQTAREASIAYLKRTLMKSKSKKSALVVWSITCSFFFLTASCSNDEEARSDLASYQRVSSGINPEKPADIAKIYLALSCGFADKSNYTSSNTDTYGCNVIDQDTRVPLTQAIMFQDISVNLKSGATLPVSTFMYGNGEGSAWTLLFPVQKLHFVKTEAAAEQISSIVAPTITAKILTKIQNSPVLQNIKTSTGIPETAVGTVDATQNAAKVTQYEEEAISLATIPVDSSSNGNSSRFHNMIKKSQAELSEIHAVCVHTRSIESQLKVTFQCRYEGYVGVGSQRQTYRLDRSSMSAAMSYGEGLIAVLSATLGSATLSVDQLSQMQVAAGASLDYDFEASISLPHNWRELQQVLRLILRFDRVEKPTEILPQNGSSFF